MASDSIDEFLTVSLPYGVNHTKPLSGSVHLHCTDVAEEWFIERDGRVTGAMPPATFPCEGPHLTSFSLFIAASRSMLLTLRQRSIGPSSGRTGRHRLIAVVGPRPSFLCGRGGVAGDGVKKMSRG